MKSLKAAIQKGLHAVGNRGKKPADKRQNDKEQKPLSTTAAAKKADGDSIDLVLKNTLIQGALYAHVTGSDSKGLLIMGADGTAHRVESPSEELQKLSVDSGIEVGGPGESKTVQVPRISGARIWFSQNEPLAFFLNPGPTLVEPSATNPSDANYKKDWGFCEFTYNEAELYVNVSYVDFVSLPIALQLENQGGQSRRVAGMPKDGLERVAQGLETQGGKDGNGWDKLVIRDGDRLLRVLSANAASVLFSGLLENYYGKYVDDVWDKYEKEDLTVNTQFDWGDVVGRVGKDGKLTFKGSDGKDMAFGKPSTMDIFTCSTGPFAAGTPDATDEKLNVGARLGAALNRSTLLVNSKQPEGESVDEYYRAEVTNHYSRVCHEVAVESRGYAFPYDDVGPSKGEDQSGFLNDPEPKVLTIEVGGSA